MNYQQALEYIHAINWTFCKPGLERINTLCEKLGHPEKDIRFIHVAGTNGKGSFCSMLSSILIEAGYKTGLYTSPHMVSFNERMRINNVPIDDRVLADITTRVRPFADAMQDRPTEFELVTAIAFLYFKEMACDVVILETGLGGRLDATNIIPAPLVSVITGIDLDHTAILGDTYAKIAAEKAGIIKPTSPVVIGDCNDEALASILDKAASCHSPVYRADLDKLSDLHYSLDGTTFDYSSKDSSYDNLSLSLAGIYQPRNCATVLECVEALRAQGFAVSEECVRHGLSKTKWIGRFEVLSRDPLVIYDGGHNPQGVSACVESVKSVLPNQKVGVLCGILRDKDYEHMVTALSEIADFVVTLTVDSPRALPAEELAALLSSRAIPAEAATSDAQAVRTAYIKAQEKGIPLLMIGSLYMYSQVIETVNELISGESNNSARN